MIPRAFSRSATGSSFYLRRWPPHRCRCAAGGVPTATHRHGHEGPQQLPPGGARTQRVHTQPTAAKWRYSALPLTAVAASAAFVGTSAGAEAGAGARSPFRLVSGVFYRPDPNKKNVAGEDGHFISSDGLAVGVADGVGGWSDSGVDAGVYARLLMSQAERAISDPPEAVDALLGPELAKAAPEPLRVLLLAHSRTRVPGSSTACVVLLRGTELQVANLGDSGFAIVRAGKLLFKSPPQQHHFNFPFQIGAYKGGDSPLDAQLFRADVQPGDVLVVATDGLWDNVFPQEVTSIVTSALRAGRSPQDAAQELVELAHERGHSKFAQTPFSVEAMRNKVIYLGGKLDDTTAVVCVVDDAAVAPATPPRQ